MLLYSLPQLDDLARSTNDFRIDSPQLENSIALDRDKMRDGEARAINSQEIQYELFIILIVEEADGIEGGRETNMAS
tara:strand:+ start:244 stop:474 length:231 start_codon:yes stop_codon:yes gene_type:complete